MDVGSLRHRVTLSEPGTPTPDGQGGYTETVTTLVSRAPASVQPATAQMLERIGANTVTPMATHLVTLRYLSGVTTKTSVTFHDVTDRMLAVTGVYDKDVRHRELVLGCVERVS